MVAPHTCPHPRDVHNNSDIVPVLFLQPLKHLSCTHTLIAHTLSHGATASTLAQTHLQTTAGSLELWNPDGPGSASPTSMAHANTPLSSALTYVLRWGSSRRAQHNEITRSNKSFSRQAICVCIASVEPVLRVASTPATPQKGEGRAWCLHQPCGHQHCAAHA